jgi:6-phospho-3-hexuloisomerase
MTRHEIDAILGDVGRVIRAVDPEETRKLRRAILDADRVYLAGAGRSGLIARTFAMRLVQLNLKVHFVGEVTTPAITSGDALVICSGSGRTESMLGVASRGVAAGARIVLVTSAIIAPLPQLAHVRVLLPPLIPASTAAPTAESTPESLLQPLRTLFEQSLFLYLDHVVLQLMEDLNASLAEMQKRHNNLE